MEVTSVFTLRPLLTAWTGSAIFLIILIPPVPSRCSQFRFLLISCSPFPHPVYLAFIIPTLNLLTLLFLFSFPRTLCTRPFHRYLARCSNDPLLALHILRHLPPHIHIARSHILSSNFWLSFAVPSHGVYFSRALLHEITPCAELYSIKLLGNVLCFVLRFVIFFNVSKYSIAQRKHRIKLLNNINILFHI